jgi:muconolactone delta-isomerase
MQYLVQMKLASHSRPNTPQEEITFIQGYIFPSLEILKELQKKKKILAGGPMSGTIGIALILEADSAQELDDLVEGLPVWPLMETVVTPLTTFDGRIASLRPKLERLEAGADRGSQKRKA